MREVTLILNNKYTIIDNFDKFEFGWLPEASVAAALISGFTGGGPVGDVTLGSYDETMQQLGVKYTDMLYPNKPISYSSDYKYMPDILRALTRHKFYLDKNSLKIEYPSADIRYTQQPQGFSSFIESAVLGGSTAWFFDITNPQEAFNKNSAIYHNDLQFEDYYDIKVFGLKVWPPMYPDGHAPPVDLEKTLEAIEAYKNVSQISDETQDLLGISGKNYFDFISTQNPPVVAVKYRTFLNSPAVQPEADELLELLDLGTYSPYYDILKRFLFLRLWSAFDGSKLLNHIYLVTDLPKGTSPFLDHDNDPTTPPINLLDYVPNTDVVTIKSTYNYYTAYTEDINVGSVRLPNIYTYYFLKTANNEAKSDYYKTMAKLGDNSQTVGLVKDFTVQKYYNIAENAVGPGADIGFELIVRRRYKAIVFSDHNALEDANSIADAFPMHNEITLPLKESNFMDLMSEGYYGQQNMFMSLLANYFSGWEKNTAKHTFALHNGASKISNTTLQILDLSDFFNINSTWLNRWGWCFDDTNRNVKFGGSPLDKWLAGTVQGTFNALTSQAKEYFTQKLGSSVMSYRWNGKKCHNEVLAFEIAKYKFDSEGKKVHLQSIFVPAGKELSYLDTQVIYGEEYIYEIFTHSLVIGAQYYLDRDWSDHPWVSINNFAKKMLLPDFKGYTFNPKAVIVRAPYYNTDSILADNENQVKETTTILDKPPLPPEIVFHPYKDISNKILIFLNVNHGEKHMFPVSVFGEDAEKIEKQKLAQKGESTSAGYPPGTLHYKTDGAAGTFFVYKTTKKPHKWKDFYDAQTTILDSTITTGYDDYIFPNTDYYYFARYEDVHGNISNPTTIFYVRIVKEGGFPSYLITKIYQFEAPPVTYERSFKKYLKIRLPDATRKLINADKNLPLFAPSIVYKKTNGQELKKYKIRLTSKKTGKKIDINVDFKKKDVSLSKGVLAPTTLNPSATLEYEEKNKTVNNLEGKLGEDKSIDLLP